VNVGESSGGAGSEETYFTVIYWSATPILMKNICNTFLTLGTHRK
jgi:hypothetical protein